MSYNRRAYWVASWAPRRLYPDVEPSFVDTPASSNPSTAPPAGPSPSSLTITTAPTPAATSAATPGAHQSSTTTGPSPAPPLYFPGAAQLARTRTTAGLPGGTSTNVAYSVSTTVEWSSHPTLRHGIGRFWRPGYWWRCLVKRDAEELETSWPVKFGGKAKTAEGEEELERSDTRFSGRSLSARSAGRDSGIALTPRGTMELQHPLAGLFAKRVDHVSQVVANHLRITRVYLSLLEMLNMVWLMLLVVALAVEGGKQGGFLKAVEISLVLVIIINGSMVNAVRMKRWSLVKTLRTLSRDWSPLPINSSPNQGLLNNFLGEDDHEALAERWRGRDQPSLRWSMRRYEGSWWLSYRPIVKVELVTPASAAPVGVVLAPPAADFDADPEETEVPPYLA